MPDLRGEINSIVTPPRAIAASKLKSKAWVSALQGVLGYLPKPKFKTQTGLDIYDAVLAGASLASWVSPAIRLGSAAYRLGSSGAAARGISAPLNQRIAASNAANTARTLAARRAGWSGYGVEPNPRFPSAAGNYGAAGMASPLRVRGGAVRYPGGHVVRPLPPVMDAGAGVGASAPPLEQPLPWGESTNVIGWEEAEYELADGTLQMGFRPVYW